MRRRNIRKHISGSKADGNSSTLTCVVSCRAINAALEKIGILIALRRGSDAASQGTTKTYHCDWKVLTSRFLALAPIAQDKRNKRGRPSSPTPSTIQNATAASTTARGSAAPSSGSTTVASSFRAGHGKSGSRASSGSVERLDVGRKVAFKAPPKKDPDTGRMEAAQWILATVKAFIPPNK